MNEESGSAALEDEDLIIRLPQGVPAGARVILESSPLIRGEDRAAYEALLSELAAAVKPRDIIEWLWVKDITDLVWIGRRLRKVQTGLFERDSSASGLSEAERLYARGYIHVEAHKRIVALAETVQGVPRESASANAVIKAMDAARKAAARKVDVPLAPSQEDLVKAFRKNANEIERIGRQIENTDRRRDTLLREIEQRRAALGAQLRRKSDEIVDAQYTVTPRS